MRAAVEGQPDRPTSVPMGSETAGSCIIISLAHVVKPKSKQVDALRLSYKDTELFVILKSNVLPVSSAVAGTL